MKRTSLLLGMLLSACCCLRAWGVKAPDTVEPDAIATDRPSFSNSSVTVPKAVIQIESGILKEHLQSADRAQTHIVQTPVLVRLGLLNNFEARLGTDGYTWEKTENLRAEGIGDLSAGFKWHHSQQQNAAPSVASVMTVVFQSTAGLSLRY